MLILDERRVVDVGEFVPEQYSTVQYTVQPQQCSTVYSVQYRGWALIYFYLGVQPVLSWQLNIEKIVFIIIIRSSSSTLHYLLKIS